MHADPRAWWKYAVSAVMCQLQGRRRHLSWEGMKQRRADKQVYIELWRSKLVGSSQKNLAVISGDRDEALMRLYDQLRKQVKIDNT